MGSVWLPGRMRRKGYAEKVESRGAGVSQPRGTSRWAMAVASMTESPASRIGA